MVKKVAGPNRRGPKGQTDIGKKIPDVQSRRQPMPATAKAGAKLMAKMMNTKVHKTVAMKEKRNKTAKYN